MSFHQANVVAYGSLEDHPDPSAGIPLRKPKQTADKSLSLLLNISMSAISFGPFLSKSGKTGNVGPRTFHTGFSLDISGDRVSGAFEIYRQERPWRPKDICWSDYYVQGMNIHGVTIPVPRFSERVESAGLIVPLDSFLASIYLNFKPAKPITEFLVECRDHLPIEPEAGSQRLMDGGVFVSTTAQKMGFEILTFNKYAKSISVCFGWVFPQDRKSNCLLSLPAGSVEFWPTRDRTLGASQFIESKNNNLAFQLNLLLRSCGKDPIELLSEEGIEAVLEKFKWSKISTMTQTEAKEARFHFVKEHPELHKDPLSLAKALITEGLYFDTTQVDRIVKQIERMIREAGH
jgi:hypothetical protein